MYIGFINVNMHDILVYYILVIILMHTYTLTV